MNSKEAAIFKYWIECNKIECKCKGAQPKAIYVCISE